MYAWMDVSSIRQMSRQVSRGYAGEYQADEQVGVARLRWWVYRMDDAK